MIKCCLSHDIFASNRFVAFSLRGSARLRVRAVCLHVFRRHGGGGSAVERLFSLPRRAKRVQVHCPAAQLTTRSPVSALRNAAPNADGGGQAATIFRRN